LIEKRIPMRKKNNKDPNLKSILYTSKYFNTGKAVRLSNY